LNDPIEFSPSISPPLIDLLTKMLQRNREERITLPRVADHPWFSITDFLWLKEITGCDVYEAVGVTRISRCGSEMKWSVGIHRKESDQGVPAMVKQREEAAAALQRAMEQRNGPRIAGAGRQIIESRSERTRRAGPIPPLPPGARRAGGREIAGSTTTTSQALTTLRPSHSLLVGRLPRNHRK
jgi:hypothetical protein